MATSIERHLACGRGLLHGMLIICCTAGLLEHALVTEASSQLHVAALGLLLLLSGLARPAFLDYFATRTTRIVQLTSHTNAEGGQAQALRTDVRTCEASVPFPFPPFTLSTHCRAAPSSTAKPS